MPRIQRARLCVTLLEVHHDHSVELGDEPGLEKDGDEAELQLLIAARVESLKPGLTLIRREYPTDIGPVDLLCRDAEGNAVVVEIKRIGEIAGVEQLLRYQERLDLDNVLPLLVECLLPHELSLRQKYSPRVAESSV